MQLPIDISAVLKAATDTGAAAATPLSVSVYVDETAPGDLAGHVRALFASAGARTRVTWTAGSWSLLAAMTWPSSWRGTTRW